MTKKNNNRKTRVECEHRFTKLEEFKDNMENDIKDIKSQITNHIPTAIKEIERKLNKRPSWTVMFIITALLGLVMFLLGKVL